MIGLSCLLARGDHAERCPRCREAAARDRAVRGVVQAVPAVELSARTRDRALAAAFAAPAVIRRVGWRVPVGLAVAAAAAVLVLASGGRRTATPPAPHALAAGGVITIGHGTVTLTADARAWQTGPTELMLLAGSVDVEVDPVPHRPFRVRTPGFVVDVVGTVFSVSLDGVVVTRGAVRISTPSGAVIVDRLAAGGRWSVHEQTAVAPRAPAAPETTSPDEVVAEPEEITMPADTARADGTPHHATPPVSAAVAARSAATLLATARSQVASKDVDGARATVRELLATRPEPDRAIRADADALLAESYMVAGDLDAAVTHYLGVAERYRDLTTGEAALFAAATYEAKAGHVGEAKRLLHEYLARYPSGSLADHAKAKLRDLERR